MPDLPLVVVAMSGGVDSSVAAALLKEQGYPVIGMMLRLWSEPGKEAHNRCCTPDAMALARRVSGRLGIPFYAVDAQAIFYDSVVNFFLDGYEKGITPNPCLVCNRQIRWTFLLDRARAMGAQYLATGHYTRLRRDETGQIQLLEAVDLTKDQSYVLHVLNQAQLNHAIFPLGEFQKSEVRQLARQFNLPVAERSDSQDLCFLADGDYRDFLRRHAPQVETPGPIFSSEGQELGQHHGLAFYTIGQRKGLNIASSVPLYVLRKDLSRNALVVGQQVELGGSILTARDVNWISAPPSEPCRVQVKIRYKATKAPGILTSLETNRFQVRFDEQLRDITPGQAAVVYDGEVCLGGGVIER